MQARRAAASVGVVPTESEPRGPEARMRARRIFATGLCMLLAHVLVACSGAPDPLPDMRGRRVVVRLVDAETVEYGGHRQSWEAFLDEIARAVEQAGDDVDALPWVVILASKGTPPGLGGEMLAVLHELGVRSISLGD